MERKMRTLKISLLVFILSISVSAQEGWFWQNPIPQGNNLNDVLIIDENTIVAVGAAGLVQKTTNGGITWETKFCGVDRDLLAIKFSDNQTGWAITQKNNTNNYGGMLLKTTNQGDDWETALNDSQHCFSSVYFLNSDTGWIGSTVSPSVPMTSMVRSQF